MTKNRSLALFIAFTGFAMLTSEGLAAEIFIEHQLVDLGTTTSEVAVMVSGGEPISEMAGLLIVGDGGTLLGNPRVPDILSVSYTGSIWENAPGGFTEDFNPGGATNEIVFPDVTLDAAGESVMSDGLLLTMTVDVTGYPAGSSWSLSAQTPAQSTALSNAGTPIMVEFLDGLISIVPEPSQLALLGCAVLCAIGYRRRLGR